MTNKYLLMETGMILGECAERTDAGDLRNFLKSLHPERGYIVTESEEE